MSFGNQGSGNVGAFHEFVGIAACGFGQTGTPAELMALYGLDAAHIAEKVREIVK